MAKSVSFDGLRVEWAEFRIARGDAGHYHLRAFGTYIDSRTGASMGRETSGWEGISVETRAEIEAALTKALFERTATALEVTRGTGLVVDGTTVRAAARGETPNWTKP